MTRYRMGTYYFSVLEEGIRVFALTSLSLSLSLA